MAVASSGYRFVASRGAGVQGRPRDMPAAGGGGFLWWADGGRTQPSPGAAHRYFPNSRPMKNDQILSQITDFCRQSDMAETTFGRRAVNDGKLVHRLREGKRITIDTLDRIQAYIAASTGRAAAAARPRSAARKARSARQFPLLREPAEIPAVRPYLQREAGDCRAGGAGACPACIRARRRCGYSTPASATARCWRG